MSEQSTDERLASLETRFAVMAARFDDLAKHSATDISNVMLILRSIQTDIQVISKLSYDVSHLQQEALKVEPLKDKVTTLGTSVTSVLGMKKKIDSIIFILVIATLLLILDTVFHIHLAPVSLGG